MLSSTACGDKSSEPELPVDDIAPRTVLLYMVARNNLSGNAVKDLNEIKKAVLNGDLGASRLLIYYVNGNTAPTLSEYDSSGNRFVLREYEKETLSVSAQRLSDVIDDVKELAPAHTYGLIMWGHGTGYVQDGIDEPGISTLSYGGESVDKKDYWMNVTTLAKVLDGECFDWIYFDCCFMAGVEVAYELRNVTDYIVASASELPSDGMPYDRTLRYLMPRKSDLDGAAKATFGFYDDKRGVERTCTMSVIYTAALDELARCLREVYVYSAGIPKDYEPQSFQTKSDNHRYGWSYYDLGHYAMALAGESLLYNKLVSVSINQAVISAYATPYLWDEVPLTNHCGLSTLIIESADDSQLERFGYRDLQWWTDVVEPRFNKQ